MEATTLTRPAPLAADADVGESDGLRTELVEQPATASVTTAISATRPFMSVLLNRSGRSTPQQASSRQYA